MIFLLTLDKTCWQKKWLEYRTIEHHYQTTWLNWHKQAALRIVVYTFFFSVHLTYILDYKTNLNKF